MTVKVVDASVAAAVVFGEESADIAAQLLSGSSLIAPRLLAYEIANIAVTKFRREPDAASAISTGLRHFRELNVALVEVDHVAVVELALKMSLTAYDASYLWLSQTEGAELLTFDQRLMKAYLA